MKVAKIKNYWRKNTNKMNRIEGRQGSNGLAGGLSCLSCLPFFSETSRPKSIPDPWNLPMPSRWLSSFWLRLRRAVKSVVLLPALIPIGAILHSAFSFCFSPVSCAALPFGGI
jgi:hypothetical protein